MRTSALLLAFLGCRSPSVLDVPSPSAPLAPRTELAAIPLDRRPDLLVSIELPPSNRPPSDAPGDADTITLVDEFRKEETHKGVDVYAVPLPIRSNLIPDKLHGTHTFGSSAPPDFVVTGPSGALPFERWGRGAGTFGYDRENLFVGVPVGSPPPKSSAYTVTFAKAAEEERALNLATSGQEPRDFVFRSLTLDTRSHVGLYLPAPAVSTWDVTVPPSGVLTFDATVLTPAIRDTVASDGAELIVEVVGTGDGGDMSATSEVGRLELTAAGWSAARFDLAAWGGKPVKLILRTDPAGSPTYDYVFVQGPTLYTPSEHPRRVVLVFVDTLRADHLGTYGYERAAAPAIDRWARNGAVFESARSVAPWTLPSARAVLSGRQPEHWGAGANLPERLSAAGYHTEAIVGNAFLSQPFQMERGWTRFDYEHMLPADRVVDRALEVLEAHPDRDTAVMVHFMDLHLPYEEPWTYRHLFAGTEPAGLESLSRKWLVTVPSQDPKLDAIRSYVIDRYDQNLRFVDDELPSLLDAAGADATVVLFADHGEEFWDHGEFEHGHSFYDELLHVPLIVRGPGVPAARVQAPVSLLDVPATVVAIEGLAPHEGLGTSLLPAALGDAAATQALEQRPQAFGRPLYGDDGWGVVTGSRKWFDRGGVQRLYEVGPGAKEESDLAPFVDLTPYPAAMAQALGRDATRVWRLEISAKPQPVETEIALFHPGGIQDAWIAYDPRGRHATSTLTVEDATLRVVTPAKEEIPYTLFVLPKGDVDDLEGLEVTVRSAKLDAFASPRTMIRLPAGGKLPADAPTLLVLSERGLEVKMDTAWVPARDGSVLPGFGDEVSDQLRELGYLE